MVSGAGVLKDLSGKFALTGWYGNVIDYQFNRGESPVIRISQKVLSLDPLTIFQADDFVEYTVFEIKRLPTPLAPTYDAGTGAWTLSFPVVNIRFSLSIPGGPFKSWAITATAFPIPPSLTYVTWAVGHFSVPLQVDPKGFLTTQLQIVAKNVLWP